MLYIVVSIRVSTYKLSIELDWAVSGRGSCIQKMYSVSMSVHNIQHCILYIHRQD